MRNKKNIKVGIIVVLVMLLSVEAYSQGHFVSTYSNLGLGKMRNTTNKRYESMGGLGIGVRSNKSISPLNPASYGSIDSLSFMFDIGANFAIFDIRSGASRTDATQGNIDYMYLGFPIAKWIKGSLGFYPVSAVGYNVISSQKSETWGEINHIYEGDGGVNSYYAGLAFNFAKIYSLGVNISYLGGTIKKAQSMLFNDSIFAFDSQVRNKLTVNNVWFNFGFQVMPTFRNGDKMVFGLTFTPQMQLRTSNEILWRSLTYNNNNGIVEVIRDTIVNYSKNRSNITMPMRIGAGFSYERPDFFTVGADVEWVNWKEYKVEGIGGELSNTLRTSLGLEIIPNIKNRRQYLSRVMYRAGFHANQDYWKINDKRIMEYGGSLGFGFPIKRMTTAVSLGFEAGVTGTTDNGLVRETYFKISLGVSLSERWFEKRRIN